MVGRYSQCWESSLDCSVVLRCHSQLHELQSISAHMAIVRVLMPWALPCMRLSRIAAWLALPAFKLWGLAVTQLSINVST